MRNGYYRFITTQGAENKGPVNVQLQIKHIDHHLQHSMNPEEEDAERILRDRGKGRVLWNSVF